MIWFIFCVGGTKVLEYIYCWKRDLKKLSRFREQTNNWTDGPTLWNYKAVFAMIHFLIILKNSKKYGCSRKSVDILYFVPLRKFLFSISTTVVIRATRPNKIQGTPITSFSVRPFRRWRERSCGAFWKSFFFPSSYLGGEPTATRTRNEP